MGSLKNKPQTIEVEARGGKFHASFAGTKEWAMGESRQEAIGSLIMQAGMEHGMPVVYADSANWLVAQLIERALRELENSSKG